MKWYVDMGQGTALSCDEVLRGPTGSLGGVLGSPKVQSVGEGVAGPRKLVDRLTWPVIQPGHRTPVEPPRQLDAQET